MTVTPPVVSAARIGRGLLTRLVVVCVLALVAGACGDDDVGVTVPRALVTTTGPAGQPPPEVAHYFGSIPTELPESWRGADSDGQAAAFLDGLLPDAFETGWYWTLMFEPCEEGATDMAARVVLFDMGIEVPSEVTRPYCEWGIVVEHVAIGTEASSVVAESGGTYTIRVNDLEVVSTASFVRGEQRYTASATTRATADLVVDDFGFTGRGSFPFGGLEPSPEFTLQGDRTAAAHSAVDP